jgi:RNA-directed DNA polymerase
MYLVYDARTRGYLARCLADAFLAGVWDERALVDRADQSLDRRPRWVRGLAREVLTAYHRPPSDRPRELARFIALALEQRSASEHEPESPRVRRWLVPQIAMGRRRWPVPELTSVGALAEFLELGHGELAWLADTRGLERTVTDERLRNYRYLALPRRAGPRRVIESPKARLKALQRRLLHEILDWIPAHDAAHGFTRGRSALSHARQHTGRRVVVRLDLEDFFASIAAARVYGIFRTAGYPEPVAHTLTGLTTNVVAQSVWQQVQPPAGPARIGAHHRLGRRLATPHLPQGAPTSPALANLAAFGLDRRLSGLASAHDLAYSRYADDLTFSGSVRLLREADRLRATIAAIAREEGFAINQQKSILATRAGCQQVCGIVVNEHPNVPRVEYDTLKAILHNLGRDGPPGAGPPGDPRGTSAGYRAHLLGRIAWVASLNPERGHKLRRRLDAVSWDEPGQP